MPRRSRDRRERYMQDRAERRRERRDRERREREYGYPMDYRGGDREYGYDMRRGRDREYDYARGRDRDYDYDYDMRGDYRGDYRRSRDYRDYADDMDEEYKEDLEKWTKKLKKYDRFGLSKDQVMQKAKSMNIKFDDYDEDEFYAIFLMHVSDYPTIANEPNTYLAMAKAWLEDKDLEIEPSEKVCKYLYEIVMADEEE